MTQSGEPTIPQRIDEFTVERVLGAGAMGVVYLARDPEGSLVALKTVTALTPAAASETETIDMMARLRREAEITRTLDHPNIVALRKARFQENGDVRYLAMEYVEGESLESRLKRDGALPWEDIRTVTIGLLRAVGHAHTLGIVHRDIKPANILMASSGEVKLADFGIARPEESNLTMIGQVLGTPLYTAPENITGGEITPRSDLFSIGVVLYEMITGRKAFAAKRMQEILMLVVTQPAERLAVTRPDADAEWQDFVDRLMRKKPEERFASAAGALESLPEELGPDDVAIGSTTYGSLRVPGFEEPAAAGETPKEVATHSVPEPVSSPSTRRSGSPPQERRPQPARAAKPSFFQRLLSFFRR